MLQLDPMLIRSTVSWLLWVQRVQQVPRRSPCRFMRRSHHRITSHRVPYGLPLCCMHGRSRGGMDSPPFCKRFFLPAFITSIGIKFIPYTDH
jgi:hypothetical protein